MCREERGREKWHPQAEYNTAAQAAQAETLLPRKHAVCIPVAAGDWRVPEGSFPKPNASLTQNRDLYSSIVSYRVDFLKKDEMKIIFECILSKINEGDFAMYLCSLAMKFLNYNF